MTYSIAIHGGAGTISPQSMTLEKEAAYKKALKEALEVGSVILEKGGTSLDAVTAAVVSLENCPLFNAGKGSVFTYDEQHEMDASVMRGDTLEGGAVSCVQNIKNPIVAARVVMEKSEHVLLLGAGAEAFAKSHNLEFADDNYFYDEFRHQQWQIANKEGRVQLDHSSEKKFGTVGAVALDKHQNLAAATSTGGMTNKRYNRIGDTPILGAGTYANNKTCAISCTGHGEFFMRAVVAYDVSCLMEYAGMTLEEACRKVVNDKLVKIGGEGGLIAIDAKGNICLPFNSEGMYRASRHEGEEVFIGIYK